MAEKKRKRNKGKRKKEEENANERERVFFSPSLSRAALIHHSSASFSISHSLPLLLLAQHVGDLLALGLAARVRPELLLREPQRALLAARLEQLADAALVGGESCDLADDLADDLDALGGALFWGLVVAVVVERCGERGGGGECRRRRRRGEGKITRAIAREEKARSPKKKEAFDRASPDLDCESWSRSALVIASRRRIGQVNPRTENSLSGRREKRSVAQTVAADRRMPFLCFPVVVRSFWGSLPGFVDKFAHPLAGARRFSLQPR